MQKFTCDYYRNKILVLRRNNPHYFSRLLSVEEIDNIIVSSNRNESKLIQRYFKGSDYWTASISINNLSLDKIHTYFQGGFSLLMNNIQKTNQNMNIIVELLQQFFGFKVNANLYFTPPSFQAFESHFDFMDTMILQISGCLLLLIYSNYD